MSIFEEIQEIICEQLKVKPEEVKLETSFIDDLGEDSLDSIELVMALEEKYSRQSGIPLKAGNIEIPDEDAEDMETVSDVVKYIAGKIGLTQE